MIRRRHAAADAPSAAAHTIQLRPLLDERAVALLRDGRLRTAAQVAAALRTAPVPVEASLLRLAAARRVLRAGHVAPEERGYGVPWPTLWGAIRTRR